MSGIGAHILLTDEGACESRSVRRLASEEQWNAEKVLACKGLPWDYGGKRKRERPLYTSVRFLLVPDTASLEELAKAAGIAAAGRLVEDLGMKQDLRQRLLCLAEAGISPACGGIKLTFLWPISLCVCWRQPDPRRHPSQRVLELHNLDW